MVLSQAKRGKTYDIVSLGGSAETKRRLYDVGFTPGCEVRLLKVAPFNGAMLFAVRGIKVALRPGAASVIEVREADKA